MLNLSDKFFSGIVEVESSKEVKDYVKVSSRKGFDKDLLTDTSRIPVTEDYKPIYKYLTEIRNLEPDEIDFVLSEISESELKITDTSVSNENICLKIENGEVKINDIPFSLVDFIDYGDSYNNGPVIDDIGTTFTILRSKKVLETNLRVALKIEFESKWDILSLTVSLDKNSTYLKFDFDWNNSQKNHLLEACFTLNSPIKEVFSEDMNLMIKRTFDPEYNTRENLPNERGKEVKTNSAPMQRGLLIDESDNNIGVVTKGLTQYEVFKNKLYIPILRATGSISNPQNPARTTPAGPPIETPSLQMIGKNHAEFYVFFGNQRAFEEVIGQVYNYIII